MIELLANVEGEYTIEKACTIVTNGKTITVKAGTDFNMASADGKYTFTAKVYVAQVGTTKYESFADAYAEAGSTTTIILLADNINITAACRINENGKKNFTIPDGHAIGYNVDTFILPITGYSYLLPNADWKSESAKFTAWQWGGASDVMVEATDADNDGWYKVPILGNATNMKFVRKNPANTAKDLFEGKWNEGKEIKASDKLYHWITGWDNSGSECVNPIFLIPNSNWKTDSARFAVYSYDSSSNEWDNMIKVNDDLYCVSVNDIKAKVGKNNLIFCRMNPANSTNNWDNKWNQAPGSGGYQIPTTGNNCFTISGWDSGSWNKLLD